MIEKSRPTYQGCQKVIIFDGPDGCGKTNIGQEISRITNIPYYKNHDEHRYFESDPSYFISAVRYVDRYFTGYLETSGASVILDRAWPSEWIYSKVMQRETDYEVLRELDNRHAKLGTYIVIPFRTDYSCVTDTYEVLEKKIGVIDQLYIEFAKWSNCKILKLNVDDENLEREVAEVLNFIQN